MEIINVLELLGGIALFLFGMNLMGEGLKKVAGNKMELVLYRLSSTPIRGILLGTASTCVIQSSAATSVMVVGFVNSGMMSLRQAIGVIMGSNIGTSITGWIICLSAINSSGGGWLSLISSSALTAIVAVVGILLLSFSKNKTKNHIGSIMLGFAVLMYGISAMSGAVAPLKESQEFINIMTSFDNPFLCIIVGIIITAILQSQSSAVGLLQTLALTGAIRFETAFPIILGIAIGASVPVLMSALGANASAKRSALSYLFVVTIGSVVIGTIFYVLNAILNFSFMTMQMDMFSVSLLNTIFRIIAIVMLIPIITPLEKLLLKIVHDDKNAVNHQIKPLEERFLVNPPVALEHCKNAIIDMAKVVSDNINLSSDIVAKFSKDTFDIIGEQEKIVDKYEDRLGSYLVKITSQELSNKDTAEAAKYLHAIGDFERISDHADNLSECAQEIQDKKIEFSKDAIDELAVIKSAVRKAFDLACEAFFDNNIEVARSVEPLEEVIDDLCDEIKLHHIHRLQHSDCTLENGFVFNDILTNYERISDHCSNLAVAVIELNTPEAGETHAYLDDLKESHSRSFDEMFKSYSEQYSVK